MKVGVIFHRLGPYHVARLSGAAEVCEISAIELAAKTSEYAWNKVGETLGFGRFTVFPEGDSRKAGAAEAVRRLEAVLQNSRPEVVAVPGWSDRGVFVAIRWCLNNDVPVMVMSESTAWDERRVWWKEWIKRRMVGLFSAALVGGTPQAAYMTQLRMPAERVFPGYDAVDNRYFEDKAAESEKTGSRNKFALLEKYFLASARFIPKKNLFRLLQAYAEYRKQATTDRRPLTTDLWHLVLLGDGPLRGDLCRLISDLGLSHSVHLPGFKQYDELPVYYGLASAFVHASTTEQWGLVVNEAMASGLPVLVSDRCGCAADLVQEGRNGFTFDPYKVEQLAQRLSQLSAFQPSRLSALGEASRQIIAAWGTERFAQGLRAAALKAMEVGPKRAGPIDSFLLKILIRR